jgi:hypothetical protein
MNHLVELQIYLIDQVLNEVDVDFCYACEDLGFKNSSFISPAMFREFLLPAYKRLTAMLRDVVEVRKSFPNFQISGGIDKRIIAEGKDAIDAELNRKVPPLVRSGGYIPCCDHSVPPDVSWENFRHYRHRLTELVVPPTKRL